MGTPRDRLDELLRHCAELGIDVRWQDLGETRRGEYHRLDNSIVLSPRLTGRQVVACLAHELGHAATALRTCDGMRETSTTASKSSAARSTGTPSARSHTTCRAPSGTSPDRPRVTHVTSCPRLTASAATALERNTLPPSTRIRMRPADLVAYLTDKRFRSERTATPRRWLRKARLRLSRNLVSGGRTRCGVS